MNRQRKADLLLVMVTAFWGASYFLTDLCLETMPPLSLNAFRFLVSFAVLGAVYFRKLRRISRKTLLYSCLIGASLVMVYTCYVYGILRTSISNAGFICALPVIFTPLLELAVFRKLPSRRFAVALILCTAGLALMTLGDTFRPALGDIICMGTAFFYAVDLLLTDRAVRDPAVDPLQLGVLQLGVVGLIMLCLTCLLEEPQLPTSPVTWGAALFLALGMVLPFLTMQVKEIGDTLLPMHLPVMLCGYLCGGWYGLAVGAVLPFLRSVCFGMPNPLFPRAVWMAAELATYGAATGFLYKGVFKKKVYASLISAMVIGRIVYGVVKWALQVASGNTFALKMFITGAVVDALPGIALQLVLVPVLVKLLEKREEGVL